MTFDEPRLQAGWYADPESSAGDRWWNGSQWTSHTRATDPPIDVSSESGQSPLAWSADSGPLATLSRPTPPATAAFERSEPPLPKWDTPAWLPAIAPGWYPDPTGVPAQRWWDGTGWSVHTAPFQPGPYGGPTVVTVTPPKSVGVAFVLTFFFGPFGMLYSTVSGALIMLGISFFGGLIVGILTLGIAWLVWGPAMWMASILWGCVAASNQQTARVVTAYR